MKVLLVFPMADRQTGLFLERSFQALGCEVRSVDAKIDPEGMVPAAASFQPDLVFCSRTKALRPGMREIRRRWPGIVTACWNVDARFATEEFGPELLELFNSVHLFYSKPVGMVDAYRRACPDTIVRALPEGIDPAVHHEELPSEEDRAKWGCDVLFVGTLHPVYITPRPEGRVGLVRRLQEQRAFRFRVLGHDGHRLYGSEHNRAVRCARIVLGHCGWASVAGANSLRDFLVLAAGGFLLTEHVNGVEEMLNVGRHCVTYTTVDDCLAQIAYWLHQPQDRRDAIGHAGMTAVHARHKNVDRIRQVLADVDSLRRSEVPCSRHGR